MTSAEAGALRRLAPPARRFLAHRKGVLVRLALWSLAESGQAFLVGHAVARSVDEGFLAGDPRRGLLWLGVALVAVLSGARVVRGVFAQLAGVTEPLRDGLVRRAVDRSMARAAPGGPGGTDRAAVSRLTNQVEIARDSFAGLVLTLRSFVFTAAGALLGLLSLHPALLVVVLPPLAAGLALFLVTLRPMAAAQRRALAADEALGDHAASARAALRDLAACGTGPGVERRGADLVADAAAAARTLAGWAAVRTAALGVAGHLPVLALLVAVEWLRGHGVSVGALLGAFTYLVQSLLPALHTLMTALGAAGSRLLVVLDRILGPETETETETETEPDRVPEPVSVLKSQPGPSTASASAAAFAVDMAAVPAVELRAVTLSYGVRAEPVLDALDLCVAPGEHLAVVGPSGIGKSTLTRLVAGTLAPSSGEVRVAGRPVTGRPAAELAALRVLVPQDAYVFSGTVGDNLAYLSTDACRAELDAAVGAFGLGPLVERQGGLDGTVRPAELSPGERQLVALVRAYLSPAPLLLLDEATCHLDPASEARAEEALAGRAGTLVVVAHRLSSAVRADRTLVLDGVRARCGTHAELLDRSPLYRDLTGHWNS
ncbi:ABC transporter ATP-binding protein [Streptomyces sp. RK23]|uniref:ATP-binding cassette domain-containing protein n=1 Tax=unclassified Streptomyces TaxID=2593676 RepID=UPI001B38DDC7|nr:MULTISPECIES: ABC transporter ATP-binding protein [unclassified Streptomyces]MBQ0966868.1 ABC transporter ATP-binding protein [Streptomyces sp. RK74B]MBQ1006986.1 ABC transporter ATP-binding protein [Streptomyces sp. RK23]